jgi:alkanesulfonate monooxygenase SsuD/methylene tetrahydromethanopterin reductase-like flavin-dependent oxidoreductase (luciferase family)
MEVGTVLIMQSFGYGGISDAQVYDQDTALALQSEEQGFDHIWVVEHHFEDYAFCPDNFVYLANLAARTSRIKLATGAAILPWNSQPIRVAEKAALLDHLSGGRLILGIGRGLSRHEFEGFGIEMGESRERFDESAPMIIEALETGWMEAHDGKYFTQKHTEIRPRPERSFKGRTWQVAMSSESALQAAHLGLPMMAFSIKAREQEKAEFEDYRTAFKTIHGSEPPRPMLADLMYCDSDPDRARDYARRYCGGYLHSVMSHYEMMGDHFDKVGGYDAYGQNAKIFKEMGMEEFVKLYVGLQSWGTPDQMLRKFEARRKLFGDFGVLGIFRYAGLPFEDAQKSQELFSQEVLPVLKSWEAQDAA